MSDIPSAINLNLVHAVLVLAVLEDRPDDDFPWKGAEKVECVLGKLDKDKSMYKVTFTMA